MWVSVYFCGLWFQWQFNFQSLCSVIICLVNWYIWGPHWFMLVLPEWVEGVLQGWHWGRNKCSRILSRTTSSPTHYCPDASRRRGGVFHEDGEVSQTNLAGSYLLHWPFHSVSLRRKGKVSGPAKKNASTGNLFLAGIPNNSLCCFGSPDVVSTPSYLWEGWDTRTHWVWVAFLWWVGGSKVPWNCEVSFILGPQPRSHFSHHCSEFLWLSLEPFLELQVVLHREGQKIQVQAILSLPEAYGHHFKQLKERGQIPHSLWVNTM